MSNYNAHYSDLKQAQEILGRLNPNKKIGEASISESNYGYAKLSVPETAQPVVKKSVNRKIETPSELILDQKTGYERWHTILGWCVQIARGQSAFIINSQGLLVAESGSLPTNEADFLASNISLILEESEKLSEAGMETGAISIETKTGWISGFRVKVESEHSLILGIIGNEPIAKAIKTNIKNRLDKI